MATELTAGLWHIDCKTRDNPNVYVVDEEDCTLVDAGWPGDERTIRAGLEQAGIGLEAIDRVLLTHYDADHVGTLARLTPALDAPVYVHHTEAPYVAGDRLPPWTGRLIEPLHRLYYRRLSLPDLPIRPVEDGDTVGGFHAYHTPGHTPEHTVYCHEGLDAVFLGDLAYGWGDGLRPSGWFTSYDRTQISASIRRVLTQCQDIEYACPGHGPPLTDAHHHLSQVLDES